MQYKVMYEQLMQMSGKRCYTLSRDNPATMHAYEHGIDVVYPSGNSVHIPRTMIVQAFNRLKRQGRLTVTEVHEEITHLNRLRTDKLMAVLRMLPGVTFDRIPRALYYRK